MCRTVHSLMQTIICGVQMMVRVFMTVILMLENMLRMILQTLYNFISFMMQLVSLIPICLVFVLTSRLKCFMCGGGGPCPVNRGGTCDCLMSAVSIVIVFFIFRSTGILDKIFYKLGYAKAIGVTKFVPSPGLITECSQNLSTTLNPDDFYDTSTGSSGEHQGEEENDMGETEELPRIDEPEAEGEEETGEKTISNKMDEKGKPEEKPEGEGNEQLTEKAGPDEKEKPEEKPEREGNEKLGEKPESEKKKPENKEKPKVLREDALKIIKKQHKPNMMKFYNTKLNYSKLDTTIIYYLL